MAIRVPSVDAGGAFTGATRAWIKSFIEETAGTDSALLERLTTLENSSVKLQGGFSGTPQDLNNLRTGGIWAILSSSAATALGMPVGSGGLLTVSPWGNSTVHHYQTSGSTWERWSLSTGWSPWTRVDSRHLVEYPHSGKDSLVAGTNDPDTMKSLGSWAVLSGSAASSLGMPVAAGGIFAVYPWGTSQARQEYVTSASSWERWSGSTGWTSWRQIDTLGVRDRLTALENKPAPEPVGSREISRAGSGVKTVPIALTLSTGAQTVQPVGPDVWRFPFLTGVDVPRWRLHARNWNRLTNQTYDGTISVDGVYLSKGSASTGSPDTVQSKVIDGFTTPADGTEYVSPWVEAKIPANVEHLLSVSVSSATGYISNPVGASFKTGGAWSATKDSPGTLQTRTPLEWWVEVEVPSRTPVIGFYGDSISSGTGATLPVFNSWPSRYCRRSGALPIHWCVPGSGMIQQQPSYPYSAHFWNVWDGYASPDVVVHFMGQNDILSAGDLATMKTRYQTVMPKIRELLSPVVHSVTITPSSLKPVEQQQLARDYNAWLKTRPMAERGVFDAAALLGNPEGTALLPEYDSGDKLHPGDAGYQALAAAFTYPITSPPISAPAVVPLGDKDTGWVSITPSDQGTGGTVWLRRIGDEVRLRLESVTINTGSTHAGYVATLPAWAVPAGPEFFHTADAGSVTAWQRMGIYNTSGRDRIAWIQTAAASSTRPTTPMSGSHRYNTDKPFPSS